jgi:hypothetical protein
MSTGAIVAIVVGAVVVAACGLCTVTFVVSASKKPAASGTQPAGARTTGGGAPPAAAATTPAPPAPPAGPKNTIDGDGTYLVGSDVMPGQYKTKVPAGSFGCYWARRKDTSGDVNGVITSGLEKAGNQVIVTVVASDKAFATKRCGTWTKIG